VASFATPEELATYLRTATQVEYEAGNPDVLDTAAAQLLLDNASAEIRAVCHWSITQETVTGQRVYPRSGYVRLPTLRLTAFAMTINAVAAVDGTDYFWIPNGGGVVDVARSFISSDVVLVTYTHGYATVPQDVRAVCLEHAAVAYPNPSRHRSETVEGVTATVYGGPDLRSDPRLSPYKLAGIA
jgi:hypothetical protein